VTTNYSPSRTYTTTNYASRYSPSRVTTTYNGLGNYTRTVTNDVAAPLITSVVEDPVLRITSSPLGKTVRTTTVNDFGLGVTRTTEFSPEPILRGSETTYITTVNGLEASRVHTTSNALGTSTYVSETRRSPVRSYTTTVYDDIGAPRSYTTTFQDHIEPVV